ncbi:KilA-N domain-containing protein [Aquitalea sp. LB_tupeE]|uniref:KilA-N domain-containing protein n=1 Tax=Aquitalea sp. LB_tupeE TaxID=2748078 RepID=UPI0015BA6583|nr:KilA-N domain-containing protein [Aquitalea sp. LB_tupeE]NWK79809.1 KilA-N domain-containing protein [Aquitalea sp. LB_tupeE]
MENILTFPCKTDHAPGKDWLHGDELAEHVGGTGKTAAQWLALPETQEYLAAMAEHLELPTAADLYAHKPDGIWLHPALYVCFARWANPTFGVWCDGQIVAAGGYYA